MAEELTEAPATQEQPKWKKTLNLAEEVLRDLTGLGPYNWIKAGDEGKLDALDGTQQRTIVDLLIPASLTISSVGLLFAEHVTHGDWIGVLAPTIAFGVAQGIIRKIIEHADSRPGSRRVFAQGVA